jgi:hypothetical protein
MWFGIQFCKKEILKDFWVILYMKIIIVKF